MGLSSLPSPSEGLLSILLQTALSISFFRSMFGSMLDVIRIGILSSSSSNFPADYVEIETPSNYIEEFHQRVPAVRIEKSCKYIVHELTCSVCLTQFEPESEIKLLSCGHVFHQVCMEKWLDYWNTTCPMCRTPLLPEEEDRSSSW